MAARGMIQSYPTDGAGVMRAVGNAIKVAGRPEVQATPPPKLGGDTETILRSLLGYEASRTSRGSMKRASSATPWPQVPGSKLGRMGMTSIRIAVVQSSTETDDPPKNVQRALAYIEHSGRARCSR